MNKIIRSQGGQQMHFMPASTPCYFNIVPVPVEDAKEGQEPAFFSVGINNVSFGVFKKEEQAEAALNELENFLLDKTMRFQVPPDK